MMFQSVAKRQLQTTILRTNTTTTTTQSILTRNASTLIIAEPTKDSSIAPATLATITAAQKLHDGPITLLNLNTTTAESSLDVTSIPSGVTNVFNANRSDTLAETVTSTIRQAVNTQTDNTDVEDFTHIMTASTKFGSHILPRAAAELGVSAPITDIVDILGEDTFVRPIYAGNALCKVQATDEGLVRLLSIRPTAFDKASGGTDTDIPVMDLEVTEENTLTSYMGANISQSDRPDLSSASTVISGGRGMQNGENFALLEQLADKIPNGGAAVGASRAAVDAGFVPNDLQVGQTGKVVAPDLYIAVGISGAIQHLSGMKDSKTIVAINNDGEAPIFQVADYGLEEDLFKALPELTEKL